MINMRLPTLNRPPLLMLNKTRRICHLNNYRVSRVYQAKKVREQLLNNNIKMFHINEISLDGNNSSVLQDEIINWSYHRK